MQRRRETRDEHRDKSITRNCPSGKRRFHDQGQAKKHLTRITQNGVRRDKMPGRAYACDLCGGWHLTSRRTGAWDDDRNDPVLKRTPLARKTVLARKTALRASKGLKPGSGGLGRRKRINPVSAARKAEEATRAKVRGEVFLRDDFTCRIAPLVPDVACYGRLTVHHLRKASAGGDYTAENLLTACARHNDWVEEQPIRAKALGLVR